MCSAKWRSRATLSSPRADRAFAFGELIRCEPVQYSYLSPRRPSWGILTRLALVFAFAVRVRGLHYPVRVAGSPTSCPPPVVGQARAPESKRARKEAGDMALEHRPPALIRAGRFRSECSEPVMYVS